MIFAVVAVSLAILFGSANQGTVRGVYKLGANSLATSLVEQAFEEAQGGAVPEAVTGVFEIKTIRRGTESKLDLNYEVTVTPVSVGLYDVLVRVFWSYQDQDFEVEREVLVSPRP
jgi:hypothetical protein